MSLLYYLASDIIRRTYAHVIAAKFVGAATRSPHSPSWLRSLVTENIRSTNAHVTVAKVIGAATWFPHSPPWGLLRMCGQGKI